MHLRATSMWLCGWPQRRACRLPSSDGIYTMTWGYDVHQLALSSSKPPISHKRFHQIYGIFNFQSILQSCHYNDVVRVSATTKIFHYFNLKKTLLFTAISRALLRVPSPFNSAWHINLPSILLASLLVVRSAENWTRPAVEHTKLLLNVIYSVREGSGICMPVCLQILGDGYKVLYCQGRGRDVILWQSVRAFCAEVHQDLVFFIPLGSEDF